MTGQLLVKKKALRLKDQGQSNKLIRPMCRSLPFFSSDRRLFFATSAIAPKPSPTAKPTEATDYKLDIILVVPTTQCCIIMLQDSAFCTN